MGDMTLPEFTREAEWRSTQKGRKPVEGDTVVEKVCKKLEFSEREMME